MKKLFYLIIAIVLLVIMTAFSLQVFNELKVMVWN